MSPVLWICLPLAAILAIVLRLAWALFQSAGPRLVTCPENQQPAGVHIDSGHAAWTSLAHVPALRLDTCSRWPERQGCGQACLHQIETAPDGCLVRNILTAWYADKNCAICGKPVGEIHWSDHKPALFSPDRKTVDWAQVRPEAVPATLETHLPVCWNCHIMQTFCREHPDLVIDRDRSAPVG